MLLLYQITLDNDYGTYLTKLNGTSIVAYRETCVCEYSVWYSRYNELIMRSARYLALCCTSILILMIHSRQYRRLIAKCMDCTGSSREGNSIDHPLL